MKCNFCGKDIEKGTGKMYVFTDGKVFWFCGSKCENNKINLGRKERKVKWTAAARAEKAVRLSGKTTAKKETVKKPKTAKPAKK